MSWACSENVAVATRQDPAAATASTPDQIGNFGIGRGLQSIPSGTFRPSGLRHTAELKISVPGQAADRASGDARQREDFGTKYVIGKKILGSR